MLPRSVLLPAVAALAALGVAQPAAAKPKPLKTAKFMAAFEASYTTNWDEPRRLTGGSVCGGLNYQQGHGSETWTVKTRKPVKLLAYKTGYGAGLHHGTWDLDREEDFTFPAFGRHTREGQDYWTTEPGTCGGVFQKQAADPKADCGTRLPEYVMRFDGASRIYPNFQVAPHMRKEKLGFTACPIVLAEPLHSGDWPRIDQKLPVKAMFGRGATVKVAASKSWDNAGEPDADRYTTASKLTWTLTLTRAK